MNKKEAIKTRTIPFVFSDESRDSYGTVLTAEGWDLTRFNRMGVALYNHSSYGSDPDNVIGRAKAWVEGKRLLGEITFETADVNPKAEKVFQKLLSGTIRGCSVGFRSLERGRFGEGDEAIGGKRETYYYGRRELLEISVTPMPANSNAKVRSMGQEPEVEINTDTIELRFVPQEIRIEDDEPDKDPESPADDNRELEIEIAKARLAAAEATIQLNH